jgi:peptidoglycan/LPS O-acetylase OafA/YrhL
LRLGRTFSLLPASKGNDFSPFQRPGYAPRYSNPARIFNHEAARADSSTLLVVQALGWIGVDLFFVMSGYLIANQVLAGVNRGEELSLTSFHARRAFRTWPAYWVVLACYCLFPSWMGGNTLPPLW